MTQITSKHIKWGLIAVVGLYVANAYFRADYLAFDRQREAWHRRCDAYIHEPARPEIQDVQASCNRELQQMLAYATRKGWRQ